MTDEELRLAVATATNRTEYVSLDVQAVIRLIEERDRFRERAITTQRQLHEAEAKLKEKL